MGEGGDSEQNFLGLFLVPMWDPGGEYPGQSPLVWEIKREEGTQVIKREPDLQSHHTVCPLYRWENGEIERGPAVPSKSYRMSVPYQGGWLSVCTSTWLYLFTHSLNNSSIYSFIHYHPSISSLICTLISAYVMTPYLTHIPSPFRLLPFTHLSFHLPLFIIHWFVHPFIHSSLHNQLMNLLTYLLIQYPSIYPCIYLCNISQNSSD